MNSTAKVGFKMHVKPVERTPGRGVADNDRSDDRYQLESSPPTNKRYQASTAARKKSLSKLESEHLLFGKSMTTLHSPVRERKQIKQLEKLQTENKKKSVDLESINLGQFIKNHS